MRPPSNSSLAASHLSPVVVWAAIGGACLILSAYIAIAWITSPDFQTVHPPAGLAMPGYVHFWVVATQVLSTLFSVILIWRWILKPKMQTGKFSLLGLISLASATVYIQDPLQSYFTFGFSYNSELLNWGSWANFIPGFLTPNMQRLPENPFMAGSTYIWFNFGYPVMFAWIWKSLDRRFPQWGTVKTIAALLLCMMVFDAIQEVIFLRCQVYGYPAAIQSLSIFPGHYYQYPVYVSLTTALFWFAMATLVYYRDDKGRSWAERGVDKLKVREGTRTFLRFLALTGACHVIFLVSYFIPSWWWYPHSDGIPEDTPAYMVNGVCGKEAGYPCGGSGVPFPRRDGKTPYPEWLSIDWSKVPPKNSRVPPPKDP